jgi:hypothetical protein
LKIILLRKKGRRKKNNYWLHSIITDDCNHYKPERRLKDGGFVAWPENKLSTTGDTDIEISEGRLIDGGYVAYPKNKSLSLHEKQNVIIYFKEKVSRKVPKGACFFHFLRYLLL